MTYKIVRSISKLCPLFELSVETDTEQAQHTAVLEPKMERVRARFDSLRRKQKPSHQIQSSKETKVAKKVVKRIMNEVDSDGNIISEFVIYERHF